MSYKLQALLSIVRLYNYNPIMFLKFIYYNFLSKNVRRYGGFFLPYKNVSILLDDTAVLELHGTLKLGIPAIPGSKTKSRLVIRENGRLCVNKKCDLMEGCDIQIHKNGIFTVDDFHSNINLEVSCGEQIRLVGDVSAGRHVRLKDFNGHEVSYSGYPRSKPIVVEDHVWICTGASINSGVHIQSGSVIADNANVTSEIPAKSFVQGNPATVVAKDISFKM